MRIFTLGKNGIPLFFFALFLFSGTYSYGQETCPGVTDQNAEIAGYQQYFCDSEEAELNDLIIEGENVTFYSDASFSNTLPATTLLVSGTTYYVDVDGCRTSIEVVVYNEPVILGIKETATQQQTNRKQSTGLGSIVICVADESNPGVYVSDLRTDAPEDSVVWFYSLTSTGERIAIEDPSTTELIDNAFYYAARENSFTGCISNTAEVRVRLNSESAPTGPANQDFCAADNPTLADIEASGDNKYYTSATSGVELSRNTLLKDDTTYFVSSVGDVCESQERLAVTVNFAEADAGSNNLDAQSCVSEIQSRLESGESPRDIFLSLLDPGVATDGEFSPTIEELSAQYSQNPVGVYETTYTVTNETGCQDSAELALTISEDPNAGEDTQLTFCQSEVEQLFQLALQNPEQAEAMLAEMLGERDTDGNFSDLSLQTLGQNYFAAVQTSAFPFEASTTYTVTNEAGCDDSATIGLIVYEDPYAGDDTAIEVAQDAEPVDLFSVLVENSASTPMSGGTWSPGNGTFDPATDTEGDFVYTVTNDNGCTDSATVTVTVVQEQCTISAGEDNSRVICNDELEQVVGQFGGVRELYLSLLDQGVPTDGTFSPSIQRLINNYNRNNFQDFTTLYTVTSGDCTDSVELTLTVLEPQEANAGPDTTLVFCSSEESIDLSDYLDASANPDGSFEELENNMFNPSQAGVGTYTFTYSVDSSIYCVTGEDSAVYTVEVVEGDANAGEDGAVTLSRSDDPVNLFDFLGGTPNAGGSFSPGNPDGIFDPSTGEAGVYTYTVGNGECVDTATVTVTIEECDIIAGADNEMIVCGDELEQLVNQYGGVRELYLSLLEEGVPTDGTFNPSIQRLINNYNRNNYQSFTTTYTVVSGDCTDSVELTLTVQERTEANAGPDTTITLCSNQGAIDLTDYLDESANQTGTFEELENNMFNPSEAGVGSYTFTYVVDPSTSCVTGEDSAVYTVEVVEGDANAGDDVNVEYCITEIEDMTQEEALNLFNSLLSDDVDQNGEFSPSIESLVAQFTSNPIGTFTTTYTVGEGACADSATISVTVNDIEGADAGPDTTLTFCTSEGALSLTDFINQDANQTGSFEELEDNMFDPSEAGVGTFSFTYTVDSSSECVEGSDSATYTVEVVETANAGADSSTEICNSEVRAMLPRVSNVRNLFLDLLDEGVSRNGTFNPTIQALADRYNSGDQIGDFTTVYTVGSGECTDSTELTVTILPNPNAGQDATVNLEEDATEAVDLFEALGGTPAEGGVWSDADGETVDATFDPTTETEGVFTYTVTSDNGCIDTATVTVVIGEEPTECVEFPAPPTVTDFADCVVTGATVADLDIAGEEGATFTVYTDEELNTPALETDVLTEGVYYVTQTNENGCESEAAELTVTLTDTPAPTISQGGNVFCEFDGATVADLEGNVTANGEVIWYTTAEGTETFSPADELENNVTYYAAVVDPDSECESSERLAVTVTLETCEIIIPEAFSPNGDGINDRFVIDNLASEYPAFTLEVYNRWGEPVYKGNSSSPNWDGYSTEGSFGDGILPAGVYFYILYYNDGQTAPTQGRVYLSR